MSAKIIGVEKLKAKLNKIENSITNLDKDLFVFCSDLIRGIKNRTVSKGADVNNQRFKRYSRKYIFSKGESGRPVYNVNLFYNGGMLGAIKSRKVSGGGEIYFSSEDEHTKAVRHQYGIGGVPQRKFFGLDAEQKKATMRMAKTKVRGAVK